METDIYPKTKYNIVVKKEEKMSDEIAIGIAIAFIIEVIAMAIAIRFEMKKAQRIWGEKRR